MVQALAQVIVELQALDIKVAQSYRGGSSSRGGFGGNRGGGRRGPRSKD